MNKFVVFDKDQILKEIAAKTPGLYEMRILMSDFYNTKLSAYFHSENPAPVLDQVYKWNYPSDCTVNFYMTINPVKEYCEAREQYYSLRKCKVMTQTEDIDRLTWFAVDVDPEHPAGTSATDEEKQTAKEQAVEVYHHMKSIGFNGPEIVDSGNGYHLKYRIDYANTEENRKFLKVLNNTLHDRFPLIDRSTTDVNRILKIPGTVAMKGRHTESRPFRMARILREADPLEGGADNEQ